MTKCVECNKELVGSQRKFCSRVCASKDQHMEKKKKGKKKKGIKKKCKLCSKQLPKIRSNNRKFCCDECRLESYRLKKLKDRYCKECKKLIDKPKKYHFCCNKCGVLYHRKRSLRLGHTQLYAKHYKLTDEQKKKRAVQRKKYRQEHVEEISEYQKQYYIANKERVIEVQSAYRKKKKIQIRENTDPRVLELEERARIDEALERGDKYEYAEDIYSTDAFDEMCRYMDENPLEDEIQ